MATIQGVYLALFGRPADPLGLSFFNTATNNGANLAGIGPLQSSAEFQARFAGQSNVQIINSIYQSLFNRDADLPGLTFFANALANGTLSINNIAIAIYDGAQGADVTIRNLKEAAANAFTAAIDTAQEVTGYQGAAAAAAGAAFIAGVTTTAPTAAQVNAAVFAATNAIPSNITINLTAAVAESVNGTAANEVINGVVTGDASTASTLNIGDVINGGGGIDTLNVTYVDGTGAALATGLPPGATVSGVEIVNLNITAAGADVPNAVTSANFAGVQQLWQVDTAVGGAASQNITVGSGVTAGFRGAGDALNLTVVQSAGATAAIALDGVTSGGGVVINEGAAGQVKTVNVSGSVAAAGAFTLDAATNTTAVDTYNVSLSSNGTVTLTTDVAVVKSINFGGSTGDITFVSNETTAFTTLTGGSGKDNLTVNNATANAATLVVNSGAGADTLNVGITASTAAGTVTLTGGAGADSFVLTGAVGTGNLLTAGSLANLQANLVSITDFAAAEDVLSITGLGLGARTTQNTVNAAVAGADIFAATTAVAGVTAVNNYSVFQYGNDTYIFENNNTAALDANDTLIQLVGVKLTDLTAANFVA